MRRSKKILVAAFCLICSAASAQTGGLSSDVEQRMAKVRYAAMNASEDFVTCFVYFKIVAVGMANSGLPDKEHTFERIAEQALTYANFYAELGGLLQETVSASANLQIKEQMDLIEGNTSNIAILNDRYMAPCTEAMQDPSTRLEYWTGQNVGRR